MEFGPVQMLVVGFEHGKFEGEILAELKRLREQDIIRLVDLLFVNKDDDGEIATVELTDLSREESMEFGALAGALIGVGAGGEAGAEAGAVAGAVAMEDGQAFSEQDVWFVADAIPPGHIGRDRADRAPLGDPAARGDRTSRRPAACGRVGPPQGPHRRRRGGRRAKLMAVQSPAAPSGPHPSMVEREARGRAARAEVKRRTQGAFEPAPDRPDPVDVLERQAASRVSELVPIRYGRMLVSPFTFYRGAAAVMAADLAASPNSGLRVQLCGDAHLSNFGGFASPDRELVFDINDFDETLPGPWEWDVKRLVASFAVGGRDRGFNDAERREVVLRTVCEYREAMRQFAEMRNLDVWYARLDGAAIRSRWVADQRDAKRLKKVAAKATAKDSMRALSKLTHRVDGELRIVSDPPLIVPFEELVPAAEVERMDKELRSRVPRRTAGRCRAARASCSRTTATWTSRARSSASAASAPARGSCCCSAATTRTRSSCRPRRPRRRCWSPTPARAASRTTASAWSRASG